MTENIQQKYEMLFEFNFIPKEAIDLILFYLQKSYENDVWCRYLEK